MQGETGVETEWRIIVHKERDLWVERQKIDQWHNQKFFMGGEGLQSNTSGRQGGNPKG